MSAALTLQNDVPAPLLEVIPLDLVERTSSILALAQDFAVITADNAEAASTVSVKIHMLHKEILARGEFVKKPLNSLLKAVRECIDRAEIPVEQAKSKLQDAIAKWDREQKRIIAEAQAKADAERKKAEEAAAAETRRLQAEADAAAAKLQRERQEAAAKAAKEIEELVGTPVAPEPVDVVKAVVIAPVKVAAPTTVVPVAAPSAVVMRKVPTVVIDDPKLVASAYSVGGEVLVTIDRAAVKRVLDAGLSVPGARIEIVEQTAQRSVR